MESSSASQLTSVVVVLRENSQVEALPHVLLSIESFIGISSKWTIARACQLPSLRLVLFIVTRGLQDFPHDPEDDPIYRQWQFSTGLQRAIASGGMELVRWSVEYFGECQLPSRAVSEAAAHGRLEILQWLVTKGYELRGRGGEVEAAVEVNYTDVAMWLKVNVPSSLDDNSHRNLRALAAANGNLGLVQWSCEDFSRV